MELINKLGDVAVSLGAGAGAFAGMKAPDMAKNLKLRDLEIPTETGKKDIKLLGLETTSGKALIIGAKTPKGLKLGTPDAGEYLQILKKE